MNIAQIEEEFKKPEFYGDYEGILSFAEHIAAIAIKEALEEAKTACQKIADSAANDWNEGLGVAQYMVETANDCADAICELMAKDGDE